MPTTCRTMRSTEMVTGTATIVSPNAGTVPLSLLTPVANVLSLHVELQVDAGEVDRRLRSGSARAA